MKPLNSDYNERLITLIDVLSMLLISKEVKSKVNQISDSSANSISLMESVVQNISPFLSCFSNLFSLSEF